MLAIDSHGLKRYWLLRAFGLAVVLALVLMLVAACGGRSSKRSSSHLSHSKSGIGKALKSQYREWKGVRYRNGGLSKKGVDCSGFVYLTFQKRLGKKIPRTTKALAKYGRKISRRSLRPGDLVFFKTGFKVRHVGIYYGDGKFIHASTSRGVMLSSLDNVYWKKHYWQARRVI